MIENSSADDSPNRAYLTDVVGTTAADESDLDVVEPATPNSRAARAYVRDVVGAKGPSDEPVLDEIEYVQYVTSEQWRRQKQPTNIRFEAAIPW